MATLTYSAESTTLTLNGFVIEDLSTGDVIQVAPVNPATSHVNSQNGLTISRRSDADVHDLTVRVQKGSRSDSCLQNAANQTHPTVLSSSMKET